MAASDIEDAHARGGLATDAPCEDDWPTTQRFSRRIGEAFHDSEYAAAIERCADRDRIASRAAAILVVGALLGAASVVLWHNA